MVLGPEHYNRGFHQTATAGAFGATVAAGRLYGLNRDQMRAALGLCATRASGLKSQFGTMGKPYHAGLAARTGVEAALLAKAGFDTRGAGIDGPQGFGPTHAGEGNMSAFDELGGRWLMEGVSHKFHACCHGLHAMLEALKGLDAAGVEKVEVSTHPRWLSVCNIADPETGLETKFSYRHAAALALCGHDTAALSSFTDALAHDADLIAVRNRVAVMPDEALTEMQARLRVTRLGTEQTLFHDLSMPLPLDIRTARLRAKGRALLGEGAEAQLWHSVHANRAPDLDALSQLMCG